ncbi:MAG: hypothetical protein PSX80_02840 [bacterium]|nr:hypothetical protein [bacterium]
MKEMIFAGFILLSACLATLSQVPPPPVADNAGPQDRSMKDRSVEMERVKRDADKGGVVTGKGGEAMAATKFNEIKEDFEKIQETQSSIVAVYQKAKAIDYKVISAAADQVTWRSERLKGNLFPPVEKEVDKKKKDKDKPKVAEVQPEQTVLPDDIKSLIGEMDNTLGVFVGNAMFSNARVVNASDHARAQSDLVHLIALSKKLKTLSDANITGN